MAETKRCPKCGETKPLKSFHRDRKRKSGRQVQCITCKKEWQPKPQYWLKRRYGLTAEQYAALLHAQGGGCAICGGKVCNTGRRLSVDHDHRDNRVRGILCNDCNRGIAAFKDSVKSLRAAIRYLAQPVALVIAAL